MVQVSLMIFPTAVDCLNLWVLTEEISETAFARGVWKKVGVRIRTSFTPSHFLEIWKEQWGLIRIDRDPMLANS